MSSGSREGGVINFMPANQNNAEGGGPQEAKLISLDERRDVIRRKAEVEAQDLGDLAETANNTALAITECDTQQYVAATNKLKQLHSDRIEFLFNEIWCDPSKIAKDPATAKAIMTVFSFRFSKANRK